jgi:stress response protein SCP2
MAKAEKLVVNAKDTPHLRVGLKWEPREIDHIKFITASNNAASAYFKVATEGGFSALYGAAGTFGRNLSASPKIANSFDASADVRTKIKTMGEQFKDDFTKPSYNLDLLCFKYDKDKNLVGLISPYTMVPKGADKSQLAILHSGDDPDGVGIGFDEEIMISLRDVADNVHTVFFVVASGQDQGRPLRAHPHQGRDAAARQILRARRQRADAGLRPHAPRRRRLGARQYFRLHQHRRGQGIPPRRHDRRYPAQ